MSEPRPPRISPVTYLATFIPGLLVIVAAVLLLWATPRSIEAIRIREPFDRCRRRTFD